MTRWMHSTFHARSLTPWLAMFLVACASEGTRSPDDPGDAATHFSDAAHAADDASTSADDSTTTPADDTSTSPTTTTTPTDSGVHVTDSGTSSTDSGASITDSGATTADTGSPPDTHTTPIDAGVCSGAATHTGGLTRYVAATSAPNCDLPWPTGGGAMFAALSTPDYRASSACGTCVAITGPTGLTAVVPVIDQCPTSSNPLCTSGHIDLSYAAFDAVVPGGWMGGSKMVPNSPGISWKYAGCPVSGNISYHWKDSGSPTYWSAVQVRNARNEIANIEWSTSGGAWHSFAARTVDLAYFVRDSGKDSGGAVSKMDLRVTDVYGHQLIDSGVNVGSGTDVAGSAQFPACP